MSPWFRRNNSPLEEISTSPTTIRANKKQILFVVLKWVLTATIFGIITFFSLFGIDFNARIYPRDFLATSRPASGDLSSVCQNALASLPPTDHYGIIPSVPVKEDDICFDYASLIQHNIVHSNTTFHTFWSSQLSKHITQNQMASIRSFAATQLTSPSNSNNLIVWIPASDTPRLLETKSLWHMIKSNKIHYRVIEEDNLLSDTPFDKTAVTDESSLVKLAALYKYGGVWFDLDVVFVRDLSPLLHQQEWLSQASCFEKSQFASSSTVDSRFAGGLMYFRAQSPYLCEMISAALDDLTKKSELDPLPSLGPHLYSRVYHRLLLHRIAPWAVLPWCFTDPTQCKKSNSLPSLFDNNRNFDKERLANVFTIRYNKKWSASQGSMFKYLDNQHQQLTSW